jgi:simple sugar transport system ATP-binding protein
VAGSLLKSEATSDGLIRLMFEKDVVAPQPAARATPMPTGAPILELRRASTRPGGAAVGLADVDLAVHPGEIVGVAGVSGNGQRELGDLILGELQCASGSKLLFGRDVTRASIGELRRQGLAFIPEDPLKMAAVPMLSVLENMAITRTDRYARKSGLQMDWPAVRRDAQVSMQSLGFSFSLDMPARALSGGNLQRMVIVRELSHEPRLIVASYPTHGLDAQSTSAAQAALLQARRQGSGVLLISENLDELLLLSDRLIVIHAGRIVGRFAPQEADVYQIGRLMTGSEAGRGAID